MKVLLINPPRFNEIVGNNPSVIESERGFNPPLGLLYIAAMLERGARHEVAVIDAQVERLSYEALRRRVRAAAPDAVGVTAMTLTLLDVLKTVELVKTVLPSAKVILGGPHVHLFPEETLNLPGVDYLVLGEGEHAFLGLADALDAGEPPDAVPGIVFRRGGKLVRTGEPEAIEDLDALPFPARRLVPYKRYSSLLARGHCVTTVITSRGCPFRCAFCDRPHLGHRFRARSARNVVDEFETCLQMGITDFLVYDDTFTVNQDRAIRICEDIRRRGLKINWDIRTRVDTVSPPLLKALRAAGCQAVHYGVEAGSEPALRALNKQIDIPQAAETFRLTRRHGLSVLAYFMIGNPGETRAEIETTFRVMRRLNPDYVHLTVLTPFPGTAIYRRALEQGIVPCDVWREFAARPRPGFVPPHWGEHFTRAELQELLARGYKQFYLRPAYMMRRLRRIRSARQLGKQLRAAVALLGMK